MAGGWRSELLCRLTRVYSTALTCDNKGVPVELITIHRHLRHVLRLVREMAHDSAAGAPAADIQAGVAELAVKSPVWQLRLGCRLYCEFVHLHHALEDRMQFPGLRRAYPGPAPALDKLEADHADIALLLGEVDSTVAKLVDDEARRAEAIHALDRLADHLITHLDFEEASLTPILRQMDDRPW